jgi:phosphoribosylaminoimidazolecarboxamide formyltransferase/IMP cyclohydrolase
MADDLKKMYRTVMEDHFPERMALVFGEGAEQRTLVFEKVAWVLEGRRTGLRYGENPGQEAAQYRLVNGNLALGEVTTIAPGKYLCSEIELLQSGKHPGKINITDADNALNILRYLGQRPACAIMKHNNPSGVAIGRTLCEAYERANLADRVAAFGGAIALNKPCDKPTAEAIAEAYAEVVVAPEFDEGSLAVLAARKNLRIMRIRNMEQLLDFAPERTLDFKSLIDGGLIVQLSFRPEARSRTDLRPAEATFKGRTCRIRRLPTDRELDDLLFGWLVEAGVTSNSVLYVKDLCTVGIGTGEQDRVGVAEIARDKAYRKLADRLCWEKLKVPYNELTDEAQQRAFDEEAAARNGGLRGAVMVSDAFFPFRDGAMVGIREGVTAIVQPGGSQNDHDVIEACNEHDVAMVFTGQRSFKH